MPPGTAPWAIQPFCDADSESDDANVVSHNNVFPLPLPASANRSPRISIVINGSNRTFILDTGAEVSIIPSSFLHSRSIHPLYIHRKVDRYTVHAFGGARIEIEGPYYFRINVCLISFIHPFYVLYNSTQFVAGYDLIHKARLVIDPLYNVVWSYYSAPPHLTSAISSLSHNVVTPSSHTTTSSFTTTSSTTATPSIVPTSSYNSHYHSNSRTTATASSTISNPMDVNIQTVNATDAERWLQDCLLKFACPVSLCQRTPPSVPQRTRSPSPTTSPSPRARASSLRPRAPTTTSTSLSPCADASINPCVDRPSPSSSTTLVESNDTNTVLATSAFSCSNTSIGGNIDDPFDEPHMASLFASSNVPSTLDYLHSTLPTHLQDLFNTTCQSTHLPSDIIHDIHDLLLRHQHTFATSSTDLGFCEILQHDINTGDSHPIKQSPRRPPFAAREAEDKI